MGVVDEIVANRGDGQDRRHRDADAETGGEQGQSGGDQSEPNVTDSTKKATNTPIRSVTPTPAPVVVYMSPPSVVV